MITVGLEWVKAPMYSWRLQIGVIVCWVNWDKKINQFIIWKKSNQVGRLGYAKPSVVLKPQKVQFPDSVKISFIATSDNHTVFLSSNRRAYACGSNQIGQLGLGPDVKAVDLPRAINFGEGQIFCILAPFLMKINDWLPRNRPKVLSGYCSTCFKISLGILVLEKKIWKYSGFRSVFLDIILKKVSQKTISQLSEIFMGLISYRI